MRRKLESKIQERTRRRALELLGVRSDKFDGSGQSGNVDVIFWLPLTWGARGPALVEFKKPGEEARDLQEHKHDQWRALGYTIGVFDNEYEVIAFLCEAMDTPKLPKKGREILVRARLWLASARSGAR